jgi:hypothetical protein
LGVVVNESCHSGWRGRLEEAGDTFENYGLGTPFA